YFKTEGIPYQRKIQTPLRTFPEIMSWISKLKIESGEIDFADLEINAFADSEEIPLRYDEFQSLFTNIYEQTDLSRHKSIEKLFSFKSGTKSLSVQEFAAWSLRYWKEAWS